MGHASSEPVVVAQVVTSIAELTSEWLSAALETEVHSVTAESVGTGQIGTCYRLELTGIGVPSAILAKLPAAEPATRAMLAGAYRAEARFYTEIGPTVSIRSPRCFHADISDSGSEFILLLEDLSPSEQGDQLTGCTVAQARDSVINLAGLHGPRWCDSTLLDIEGLSLNGPDDAKLLADLYGPATDIFIETLEGRISADDQATLRDCVEVAERWALGRTERFGLVHGDYRLDNLMFPPKGGLGVAAIDWQTLSLALPARDLAYFIGTSLPVSERREHERGLVADYHRALRVEGVDGYSFAECWDDYRFAMIQGPLVAVFGCAYGNRTDRGDEMFAVMVGRACAAIRELDTLSLVEAQN